MSIEHSEGGGKSQRKPVNTPLQGSTYGLDAVYTTEPSSNIFQALQAWSGNKYAEHGNWGVRRYAKLLDLPPSVFSSSRSEHTWRLFRETEAKPDHDLIELFPKAEDRGSLLLNAQNSAEWIRRRCFDWDYLLQSPQTRSMYPSSQEYWNNRDEIIATEYQNAQRKGNNMSLEEFTQAYWSALCYDFVSARVMGNYLTVFDLKDIQQDYPNGYHGYLEDHGWHFAEHNLRPRAKKATDELVVHALSRDNLDLALTTGRLGHNGIGRVVFSEDRVCYDDGFAVVFSLVELQAIYPMYQFDEHPVDAHLLQEWRSPVAVDMNLALACIPTTERYFGTMPQGIGPKVYGLDVIQAVKQRYKALSK